MCILGINWFKGCKDKNYLGPFIPPQPCDLGVGVENERCLTEKTKMAVLRWPRNRGTTVKLLTLAGVDWSMYWLQSHQGWAGGWRRQQCVAKLSFFFGRCVMIWYDVLYHFFVIPEVFQDSCKYGIYDMLCEYIGNYFSFDHWTIWNHIDMDTLTASLPVFFSLPVHHWTIGIIMNKFPVIFCHKWMFFSFGSTIL